MKSHPAATNGWCSRTSRSEVSRHGSAETVVHREPVTVITTEPKLARGLWELGWPATAQTGEGEEGPVTVVFVAISRQDEARLHDDVHRMDPGAFVTTEELRTRTATSTPGGGLSRLACRRRAPGSCRYPEAENRLLIEAASSRLNRRGLGAALPRQGGASRARVPPRLRRWPAASHGTGHRICAPSQRGRRRCWRATRAP
jgi:Uncharacterized protein conserved in bacteria (DUF2179)